MKTLLDLFGERSDKYGSKTCIKVYEPDDNNPANLTYQQLYCTLVNNSRLLKEAYGLSRGDTVLVLSDNSLEFLLLIYSAVFAGVSILPVSTQSPVEHLEYFIQATRCKCIFRSPRYADLCDQIFAGDGENRGMSITIADLTAFSPENAGPEEEHSEFSYDVQEIKDSDIAIILHTSGTTKTPKLVPLSHRTILNNQMSVHRTIQGHWTKDDCSLGWLPLFHCYALIGEFMRNIYAGSTYTLFKHSGNPSAEELIHAIDATKTTILCCVPWMLRSIQEHVSNKQCPDPQHVIDVLKRLNFIITGGAELTPQIGKFYDQKGIKIVSAFGMTEAAGFILFSDFVSGKWDILKFISDDRIRFVQAGGSGETGDWLLVLTGNGGGSESVREAASDHDMETGDLFRKTADGWVYSGRGDQIYNSLYGEKINPSHFEAELEKHEAVEKAFVFGENMPFNTAVIELVDGIECSEEIVNDVHAYVQEHINPLMDKPARVYPNDIHILNEGGKLPRTPKGNVDRKRAGLFCSSFLQTMHEKRYQPNPTDPDMIASIIVEETNRFLKGREPVNETSNVSFLELGFDSLMLLSLKNSLDEKLHLSLPIDLVLSFPTLQTIINCAQNLVLERGQKISGEALKTEPVESADGWRNINLEQVLFHTAHYAFPFPTFNASMSLLAPRLISQAVLEQGMQYVESRHDVMRMIFRAEGTYKVLDTSFVKQAFIGTLEFTGPHDVNKNYPVQEKIKEYLDYHFNLDNGPPYVYALINITNNEKVTRSLIYFGVHHTISDFMGFNILIGDLLNYLEGRAVAAKTSSNRVRHDIVPVSTEQLSEFKASWLKILTVPPPDLDVNVNPLQGSKHIFNFSNIKLDTVAERLGKHNISLFNGLYSVWILVAEKHFSDLHLDDFLSTTGITSRVSTTVENLAGCYVYFPFIKFKLDKRSTLKELMQVVQKHNTEIFTEVISHPVEFYSKIVKDESYLPPMIHRNVFFFRADSETTDMPPGWTCYRNEYFIDRCEVGVYFDVCASKIDHSMEGYVRINHNYCDASLVQPIIRDVELLIQHILEQPDLESSPDSIIGTAVSYRD